MPASTDDQDDTDVPTSELPPILYKYCDPRGLDILRSRRVKVTPFNEFNDPFELAPRMRPDFPLNDAKAAVTDPELIRKLYEISNPIPPFDDFEQFAALIISRADELAAKNVANYANDAAHFRETHLAMVSPEFGLICLSGGFDDILMWAHYTRGHTGLVVGFDTSHKFFSEGPPIYDVVYRTERVLIGHYYDHRDRDREVIKELIRRKSTHWSYEREWRQLRKLSECQIERDANGPGKHLFYVRVPPEAIAEVIIGCRCNESAVDEVLVEPIFNHVRKQRARIHEGEFTLTFE